MTDLETTAQNSYVSVPPRIPEEYPYESSRLSFGYPEIGAGILIVVAIGSLAGYAFHRYREWQKNRIQQENFRI